MIDNNKIMTDNDDDNDDNDDDNDDNNDDDNDNKNNNNNNNKNNNNENNLKQTNWNLQFDFKCFQQSSLKSNKTFRWVCYL